MTRVGAYKRRRGKGIPKPEGDGQCKCGLEGERTLGRADA